MKRLGARHGGAPGVVGLGKRQGCEGGVGSGASSARPAHLLCGEGRGVTLPVNKPWLLSSFLQLRGLSSIRVREQRPKIERAAPWESSVLEGCTWGGSWASQFGNPAPMKNGLGPEVERQTPDSCPGHSHGPPAPPAPLLLAFGGVGGGRVGRWWGWRSGGEAPGLKNAFIFLFEQPEDIW